MILEHVWNSSFEGLTNVVDVYISALRTKIDRDFTLKLIQTNRGIGYTFLGGECTSGELNGHMRRLPRLITDSHGGEIQQA
jgi:DNA-binding winged helix-turn-helix (wHTH) protein